VEVGIIGREGIVGLPAVFGVSLAAAQGVAQMDLSALRIRVTDFHEHLSANRALLSRIERYAAVRFGCLAQTAACNRLHRTHQRLCRWLLLVRDLAGSNELPITHEFLGLMLGARRASVSEAAAELQARGLIRYEPGMLHYLDVAGVEELACECYGIIRRLHETL
jgi:CRP-like cAMP-binding protein